MTLRRRLRLGTFAALDQRVALRYEIPGMEPTETTAYVKHHLALAGRDDTLFSDDALALLHRASRGVPRLLNNLATQALVAAYADKKAIVDESSARAAMTEVTAEEPADMSMTLAYRLVMAAGDPAILGGSGRQQYVIRTALRCKA